jgi:hypothetical protein
MGVGRNEEQVVVLHRLRRIVDCLVGVNDPKQRSRRRDKSQNLSSGGSEYSRLVRGDQWCVDRESHKVEPDHHPGISVQTVQCLLSRCSHVHAVVRR